MKGVDGTGSTFGSDSFVVGVRVVGFCVWIWVLVIALGSGVGV